MFAAGLTPNALRLFARWSQDHHYITEDKAALSGRRMYVLMEACLALRKAVVEEERVVLAAPDSERLVTIQAESTSTRRLLTLQLEMSIIRRFLEGIGNQALACVAKDTIKEQIADYIINRTTSEASQFIVRLTDKWTATYYPHRKTVTFTEQTKRTAATLELDSLHYDTAGYLEHILHIAIHRLWSNTSGSLWVTVARDNFSSFSSHIPGPILDLFFRVLIDADSIHDDMATKQAAQKRR
ncbi:hypothetical protein O1611_g4863 [Lasiodiplodia mahajangana]|uniref:Uncharacterized protein n=1 Tax=Lasiodiplodia mahajangana TaxID=1108764 RepID=A0ACC2JMX2_9PEZI|nr:hypothetical protein O1611_g4863 [Lasiodiplodia mahajangana]